MHYLILASNFGLLLAPPEVRQPFIIQKGQVFYQTRLFLLFEAQFVQLRSTVVSSSIINEVIAFYASFVPCVTKPSESYGLREWAWFSSLGSIPLHDII